jgi:signal transduction histidine kinase
MAIAQSELFITDRLEKERVAPFHELLIDVNRAYTLTSIVQIVGRYCSTVLDSPIGMMFVERNDQPPLVLRWRSDHLSKECRSDDLFKKGPITHAFRTGSLILWSEGDRAHTDISRYLRRFFPGPHQRTIAFLPIGPTGEAPVGVIAMVLLHLDRLNSEFRTDMHRLSNLVSECIARARAYDEALAARIEAENLSQRKEEFLSVLSHELRSPLAPILGWAVALSSGTLPAEKQSLAIEGIVRNTRALSYLIDDLFDVARISSGKLHLELAEIRIQEVAREALTAIQQTIERKKLRISTDISEAIPPFLADARRIRQVVINLLNNAVKFTPEGGSITLKVLRDGHAVQITVSDTGKGIAQKFLPFVFDRFRQEYHADKTKGSGLGLGLTIVREIVELHGGAVQAHSPGLDRGATFMVRLPLRKHKNSVSGNRGRNGTGL